jgi:O-antigen/teichoic acid export membrane protein
MTAAGTTEPPPSGRLRSLLAVFGAGGVPLNTAATSTRTIVRSIVGILMLPLLVHRIGLQATGLFVFATTLTGYFTAVEFGLATSVTKYVAEYRATGAGEELNSVLRGSLVLMAALGLLIALGLAGFGLTYGEDLFDEAAIVDQVIPTFLVAAFTAFVYFPSRLGVAALEGLERFDLSGLIGSVCSAALLGVMYWVTSVSDSVALLTALFGSALVVEGAICGALAWRHIGVSIGRGRWLGPHLRPVLAFGGALFLIGFADTLVYSLDRTIVAGFVGASAIVAYEAALRPQNGVRAVSSMASGALIPTMSRLFAQGRTEAAHELILIASLLGVLITTPVAIVVIVLAEPFVIAWLGPQYAHYAVYVQIFTNTAALGTALAGLGRLKVFVWLTIVGSVVTLALSIYLTAQWGVVGVIWGTVIPAWLSLPLWMHLALRHVGLSWRPYVREVLVPGFAPLAIWTAAFVGASTLLDPQGYLGVLAVGGVALLCLWGAVAPMMRRRWRRAVAFAEAA